MKEEKRIMDKQEQIEEMVKKLYGIPPYDDCYNVCRGDGYYKEFIINKFGSKLFEETCQKLSIQLLTK